MAEFTLANVYQRLMKILRYGNVHSVQADPPRCRVTFGTDPVSGSEHVSDWLNWSARSDSEVNDWSMPAVGAAVMVLSPGGETDGGLVFPAGYSNDRPPPATVPGQHVTQYSDGATVMYDTQAHAMTVTLPDGGKVTVTATGGLKLVGDTEIDGNLDVTGDVKDKTGSMQAMRDTHNIHEHDENGDGGGTTSPPNQIMQSEEPDQ
ncbi:phage baseplate assembly protein V [Scandinavium goeteborgense]|uniref:phage baseplate assembly protein V n=1 Tax=Scandinavium goeteborgense TaxID=1851514 RepID=UPI002165D7AD|nr:phage baseplate assembly protein V [Scandinavium goeteborgense]MCS2152371.1 phage baseplate assembly protein V [Scandinavium goeteborgense]